MSFEPFVNMIPYLTNPVSLAGYALLLFVSLAKALLKAKFIPVLTRKDGANIVVMTVNKGFYLAALTIALGFVLAFMRIENRTNEPQDESNKVQNSNIGVKIDENYGTINIGGENRGEPRAPDRQPDHDEAPAEDPS